MFDPFGVGEKAVADAVELPDAFGHRAESAFHHVEVKDRVVVVVFLGLDHPEPFPSVVPDCD